MELTHPRRLALAFLAFLLLGLLIYSPSFSGSFYYDDEVAISNNAWLEKDASLVDWFGRRQSDPTGFFSGPYRPLTMISYALNNQLSGMHAGAFRAVNVAIHALTACLIVLLFQLLVREPRYPSWLPLLAGLLFLTHPIATQSLALVWKRATLLVTLFYTLSFYLYLRFQSSNNKKWLAASLVSFVVALLCKESAISLPALILVTELSGITSKQSHEKLWKLNRQPFYVAIYFVIGLTFVWIFNQTTPGTIYTDDATAIPARLSYLLTQVPILMQYLSWLFIPLGLNIDHQVPWLHQLSSVHVWPALLANILLIGIGAFYLRKKPLLGLAIASFYIVVSPALLVILPRAMDETRVYLPLIVFAIALPSVLFKWFWHLEAQRKIVSAERMTLLFCLMITLSWAGMTLMRSFDWSSSKRIWAASLEENASNPVARFHYGKALEAEGDLDGAMEEYRGLLGYEFNSSVKDEVLLQLGLLLGRQGKLEEAMALFEQLAKREKLISADASYLLGLGYFYQGDYGRALEKYQATLQIKPTLAKAHFGRAMAYEKLNQKEMALKSWKTYLSQPDLRQRDREIAEKAITRLSSMKSRPQNR